MMHFFQRRERGAEMTMWGGMYGVFALVDVFYLPGYLISRIVIRERDYLRTFTLSLTLSITLVPVTCFACAMLFRTFISETLVLSVATAINLCCLGYGRLIKVRSD